MVEDLHTAGVTVKLLCDTVEVSKSGYYAWAKRPESERATENIALLARIRAIHEISKQTYGSPRMTASLQSEGIVCGENRIARLMRENNIASEAVRKFKITTTDSNHDLPIADRIYETENVDAVMAPNQVWVGDITYSTPSRSGPAGCRKERKSIDGMRTFTKGGQGQSPALCYERA
jgi:hypothetical protein